MCAGMLRTEKSVLGISRQVWNYKQKEVSGRTAQRVR